jgi:glycosyltransferase involved in cell wall biosynthesis
MSPRLSVAIATLNEEANLDACLGAVRWADEIVVVDDGSTDATLDVARRYTDRVIVRPSEGNFHANKNLAIAHASGDWILSLDADEIVPPALADEIRAAIRAPGPAAFRVGRRNHFLGHFVRHGGWYPDRIVRLFRKGVTEWPLEIHRTPEVRPPATVGDLRGELVHESYRSLDHYVDKFNQYTTRLAHEARAHGATGSVACTAADVLLRAPAWFAVKYVVRGGFRDGMPGLFIATSSAFVIAVTSLKVREMAALAAEGTPR